MKTKTNKNIFAVAMLLVLLLFSALLFPIKAQNVVMAVSEPLFSGTNLSGTTWLFNETVDISSVPGASINFTSNETNFNEFYYHVNLIKDTGIYYGNTMVYKTASSS